MTRLTTTGRVAVLWLVGAAALLGCSKGGDGGGASASGATTDLYKAEDNPDNLKGLVDSILKASESGDAKKAAALTRSLIPDEAALKKALRDDAPADFVKQAVDGMSQVPADDTKVAGLIHRGDPARTQINVHGATTEDIKTYANGSVAYNEFPGGARKLADQVLRPGMKFYEAEMVKPGEDSGMKYHMFYWDGARWRMLGPAWRALR